jgi:hypothetical protein
MSQSDRAAQGYLTRGTQSVIIGGEDGDDKIPFFDMFRQGVDLRSYADLSNFISFKIRVESDPVPTINGRKVRIDYFDDSLQDVGSSFGNDLRLSGYFNHEMERRDLGQIEVWERNFGPMVDRGNPLKDTLQSNGSVQVVTNLDPVFIADTNVGELPLDGFIEPLMIRSEAERSHPEFPFLAKGFRGSVGQVEDAYRRNDLIRTGYNVPKNESEYYDLSSQHFLDATEYYGPVDLMPVFAEDLRSIVPFKDRSNDRELLYESGRLDDEIVAVLTHPTYTAIFDDNAVEFDIMGRNGWIFNDAGGRAMDSLAYGGLLRG